jgi:hypothetical protein
MIFEVLVMLLMKMQVVGDVALSVDSPWHFNNIGQEDTSCHIVIFWISFSRAYSFHSARECHTHWGTLWNLVLCPIIWSRTKMRMWCLVILCNWSDRWLLYQSLVWDLCKTETILSTVPLSILRCLSLHEPFFSWYCFHKAVLLLNPQVCQSLPSVLHASSSHGYTKQCLCNMIVMCCEWLCSVIKFPTSWHKFVQSCCTE